MIVTGTNTSSLIQLYVCSILQNRFKNSSYLKRKSPRFTKRSAAFLYICTSRVCLFFSRIVEYLIISRNKTKHTYFQQIKYRKFYMFSIILHEINHFHWDCCHYYMKWLWDLLLSCVQLNNKLIALIVQILGISWIIFQRSQLTLIFGISLNNV